MSTHSCSMFPCPICGNVRIAMGSPPAPPPSPDGPDAPGIEKAERWVCDSCSDLIIENAKLREALTAALDLVGEAKDIAAEALKGTR